MENVFFWLIPVVAVAGGMTAAIVATIVKGRIRELEIRERIAMIERGLVPPPELDPRGFESAMDRVDLHDHRSRHRPGRYKRGGITVMGVGFATMVLIGFTSGAAAIAMGVGGFLVIIGFAIFINGLFERNEPAYSRDQAPYRAATPATPTPAPPPPEPPRA